MKYAHRKRLCALLLSLVMVIGTAPQAFAAEGSGEPTFSAVGPQTVVVAEGISDVDLFAGSADSPITASIARDYGQEVQVSLENTLDIDIEYYMTVENPHADLSMNFVDVGTTAATRSTLTAGGTATVKLAIFAQEAEESRYNDIRLVCHIVGSGKTERTLDLTVTGEGMTLTAVTETLPNKDVQVKLTNTGADVNSLKVVADSDLAPYAFFPEPVTNAVLAANGTLTFIVSPAKVDTGAAVSGKLLAKGNGTTVEIPIQLEGPSYQEVSGQDLAKERNKLYGAKDPTVDSLTFNDTNTTLSYAIDKGDGSGNMGVSVGVSIELNPAAPSDDLTAESAWVDNIQVSTTNTGNRYTFTVSHYMTAAEFEALAGSGAARTVQNTPEPEPKAQTPEEPASDAQETENQDPQGQTSEAQGTEPQKPESQETGTPGTELSKSVELEALQQMKATWTLYSGTTASAVLMKYQIEVDFGDADISDFNERFNDASENSARLGYLDNLPGVPKSIKERYAAALEMQMLLNLLNEMAKENPGKYEQIRQKVADKINEQYNPPVDDPIKTLEETIEKLIESTEKTIERKYPEFKEQVQDDHSKNKGAYSNVVINENGHQCTNRGSITSPWYVNDSYELGGARSMGRAAGRTAADIGARVYYTGRIKSEDRYVNFEPITYDLILNGTRFGVSRNSGLSELNIIELDPSLVLLGQTNSFTRDYDVNPGTHFVNTDNQFIVVYPEDAVLKVTDPSLVQPTLPDFDVYSKNIFVTDPAGNYVDEPIAGANTIHVSISNRGARGGFYQLSIKDSGDNELLSSADASKYRYMPAFYSQTLNLDVNLSPGPNGITVEITDCSGRFQEADSSNNIATMTLDARARQVPAITKLTPDGEINVSGVVTASAQLSNYADVKSVTFTLDGGTTMTADYGRNGLYSVSFPISESGIANGDHTISASVTYLTGEPNSAAISRTSPLSQTFKITEGVASTLSPWASVTLPAGVNSGSGSWEWQLVTYDQTRGRYTERPCWGVDGGSLIVRNENPSGQILLGYDRANQQLYAGTVGAKDVPIDLSVRRTLRFTGGTLSNRSYPRIYLTGISNFQLAPASGADSIELPPLALRFSASFQIPAGNSSTTSLSIPADLTAGDQTVDLGSLVQQYAFTLPSGADHNSSRLLYAYPRGSGGTIYSSLYMTPNQQREALTLSYQKSSLPDSVTSSRLEVSYRKPSQAGGQRDYYLHLIDPGSYSSGMDLGGLTTRKLSFTAQEPEKLSVTSVDLTVESYPASSLYFYSPESISCTPGRYIATIEFSYDGENYVLRDQPVDLTGSDQVISLAEILLNAELSVTWPESYGEYAEVTLYLENGDSYRYSGVENGTAFPIAPDTYTRALIRLWRSDNGTIRYTNFTVNGTTVEENGSWEITLGSTISGTLRFANPNGAQWIYAPGDSVPMILGDLHDEYGNTVTRYDPDGGSMPAYILFQPETGRLQRQEVTLGSINSETYLYPIMPSLGGSYAMAFTTDPNRTSVLAHTIQASAGEGGDIQPAGNIPVFSGANQTFDIQPYSGWRVLDVLVDGASVGAKTSYTFQNVTGDHTIEARFTRDGRGGGYLIRAETSTGGSISPVGDVTVAPGADQTFVIQPGWGYSIQDVMVDGVSQGAVSSYTFRGVSGNHTISASFTFSGVFLPNISTSEPQAPSRTQKNGSKGYGGGAGGASGAAQKTPAKKPEQPSSALSFQDVPAGCWYYDDLRAVYEKGLFGGISDLTFAPDRSMNRAMFVTVLSRLEKALNGTEMQGTPAFTDTEAGRYYSAAVAWASENGITNGYEDGSFGIERNITRQQACVFFIRYLESIGYDLSEHQKAPAFTDNARIASWASEAVGAAADLGLVNGLSDGSFNPEGLMTRAQCAAVFHRLMTLLNVK